MNNQPSRYGEATRELRALTDGLTVAEEDTARAVILYELIGQVDQATLAEAIDRAKDVLELRRRRAVALQARRGPHDLPLHLTAANVGVSCPTCDDGGCPDCTDPA